MHPATVSVKVFGAYVVLTGVGLVLVPDLILSILGLVAATEIWIRVLGALAFVVGYYYWSCATAGDVAFYKASIVGRSLFAALCVALIFLAQAPVQLLLFAALDLVGAAWTWHGLRKASRA